MTATKFDPELCRRLAAECIEDDARMTTAPWALDEEIAVVFGNVDDADGVEVACLGEEADNHDGDGPGVVRTRNNLPTIAAQLTAAAELHGDAEGWRVQCATNERSFARVMTERDAYRATLCDLLASAHPHPVEHPTMAAQWARARELLKNGPAAPDKVHKVAPGATAAADLAERQTLTKERAREVVVQTFAKVATLTGYRFPERVVEDIATRAAKELAGAVIVGPKIAVRESNRHIPVGHDHRVERRVPVVIVAIGDHRLVCECRDDAHRSQVYRDLATAFDRASVAITGQSAADLSEQLKPARLSPSDAAIIDRALDFYARVAIPTTDHADIARIRAALTATPPITGATS